jgi:hypothetical protein
MRAALAFAVVLASCNDRDVACPPGTEPVFVGRFESRTDRACRRPDSILDGPRVSIVGGREWLVGRWRDGKRVGEWQYRHPDGSVGARVSYRDGQVDGSTEFYRRGDGGGTWINEDLHETRTYAFDGTLIVWNGRAVPPPPERIRLTDGRWLVRSECTPATWDTGFASPCLDLFEAFQRCATHVCRDLAIDGYLVEMQMPQEPFWKLVL